MDEKRTRLLLVDDEVSILSALRRTLRREGYEILCAESAEEALEIVEQEVIDLVISDHKMPGMSGVVLLARVAALQPATARFLLSGWTQEIPRGDLEAAGVRALLSKPWDDAQLKGQLRDALKG